MINEIEIPILVYTRDSKLEDLGIDTEEEREEETIVATFRRDLISAYYSDKDSSRTVFHLLGDMYISPITYLEFKNLLHEYNSEVE